MMVTGGYVLIKKDKTTCTVLNSCSLKDQIVTSFDLIWLAGLKIIVFFLSYTQPALRQVKHIKFYQNYYPKLRRNTGVGVVIERILTTYMNVSGIEH
jgi:hypothetical protein